MKFRIARKKASGQKRAGRRSPYPEMDAMTSSQLDEFMNSEDITLEQYTHGLKLRKEAARA